MDAQHPMATVEGLVAFAGRGAGSDAERRAANWLAAECAAAGWDATVETFWSRPNWAFAHLWHVALAVAGSLIALASPIAAIVLLAIALSSVVSDALAGLSLGRRLTPERASQNVIATLPGTPVAGGRPTRLVLTANYDAGRVGLAYRLRFVSTRLTRALHGVTPGWLGWLSLAIVWLLAVAVLRETGDAHQVIGAVQLPPTVGLLLGFALLLDLATGSWSPGAGDNATGAAALLGVANSLAAAPPEHLELHLVLSGAGEGEQIGLRRYLRARRREERRRRTRFWPSSPRHADTIVLGIAACGGGTPRWWRSDGSFLPLRYSASLRRIAEQVADEEAHLGALPHTHRGSSGAFPARMVGLPALTIGCLDPTGLVPQSHSRTDTPAAVDADAIDKTAQFALLLIDGFDSAVAAGRRPPAATPA